MAGEERDCVCIASIAFMPSSFRESAGLRRRQQLQQQRAHTTMTIVLGLVLFFFSVPVSFFIALARVNRGPRVYVFSSS
jgi:hypothetical protein